MTTSLPPAAQAALDAVVVQDGDQPEVTKVETVKTSAPQSAPGFFARWLRNPFQRLLKMTTMTALTAAIVVLGLVVAGLISFIIGGEVSRNEVMKSMTATAAADAAKLKADAMVAAAKMKEAFMKPAPVAVNFKHGGVEGYGFIRNFFWRNDSEKSYAVAATVVTAEDGTRSLENTSVKVTSDGETFQLKAGTQDTWVLLAPPPAKADKEAPKQASPPAPVTAAK